MTMGSNCGMIRNRFSVDSFDRREDVPVLMMKNSLGQREHAEDSFARVSLNHPPKTIPVANAESLIGIHHSSKNKNWMVLKWEDVPLQIVEMPVHGGMVEFSFHEDQISQIESLCKR